MRLRVQAVRAPACGDLLVRGRPSAPKLMSQTIPKIIPMDRIVFIVRWLAAACLGVAGITKLVFEPGNIPLVVNDIISLGAFDTIMVLAGILEIALAIGILTRKLARISSLAALLLMLVYSVVLALSAEDTGFLANCGCGLRGRSSWWQELNVLLLRNGIICLLLIPGALPRRSAAYGALLALLIVAGTGWWSATVRHEHAYHALVEAISQRKVQRVGWEMPNVLLRRENRSVVHLREMISGTAELLFIAGDCPACDIVLRALTEAPSESASAQTIIINTRPDQSLHKLSSAYGLKGIQMFDIVDRYGLHAIGLSGVPHSITIDGNSRVVRQSGVHPNFSVANVLRNLCDERGWVKAMLRFMELPDAVGEGSLEETRGNGFIRIKCGDSKQEVLAAWLLRGHRPQEELIIHMADGLVQSVRPLVWSRDAASPVEVGARLDPYVRGQTIDAAHQALVGKGRSYAQDSPTCFIAGEIIGQYLRANTR